MRRPRVRIPQGPLHILLRGLIDQSGRSSPSQGGNPGSNPGGSISFLNKKRLTIKMVRTDLGELLDEISGFFIFPSATVLTGTLTRAGEAKFPTHKFVFVDVRLIGIIENRERLNHTKRISVRIENDDSDYHVDYHPKLMINILKAISDIIKEKNLKENRARSGIIYSFSTT